MLHRSDIPLMKETHDLDSLEKALRYPNDSHIRKEAASALGELDALQSSDSLINSFLRDPEEQVRNAAREALELLLGNQAENAISIARLDNSENTPWLENYSLDESFKISSQIEDMMDNHDVDGIEKILINSPKTDLRKSAAIALGELDAFSSSGNLALSYLRDPSKEVRAAARQALDQLMGKEAENVINVAKSDLTDNTPFLQGQDEEEDDDSSSEDNEAVDWSDDEVRILIKLAQQGNDINLRVRALRTLRDLALNQNIHAVDALASVALLNEDPPLNDFAMQALEEIFGDELQAFLKDFQEEHNIENNNNQYEEESEDEEEDFLEDGETPSNSKPFQSSPYNQPPVIQEEGPGRTILLLAAFVILAALILFWLWK